MQCSATKSFSYQDERSKEFIIPCQFEHILVDKCLCDLGSSVNLMPLSFFRKLKFTNIVPTQVILQLADHSVCYPMGIVEDLLVKVGKFYFPTDFIVFYMEEDISIPIILGRGFLATRGATMDLLEGKLTLKVGTEKEEFNVFKPLKYPSYEESCSYIAATNELYGEKYVLEQDIGFMPLHDHFSYSSLAVWKYNVDVKNYAVLQVYKLEDVRMGEPFHPP